MSCLGNFSTHLLQQGMWGLLCSDSTTSSFHWCSLNSWLKKSVDNSFQFTFPKTLIFPQDLNHSLFFLTFPPIFPYTETPGTSEATPLLPNLPIKPLPSHRTFSSSTLAFPRAGIHCYTSCSWHTQNPRKFWQNQSCVDKCWGLPASLRIMKNHKEAAEHPKICLLGRNQLSWLRTLPCQAPCRHLV